MWKISQCEVMLDIDTSVISLGYTLYRWMSLFVCVARKLQNCTEQVMSYSLLVILMIVARNSYRIKKFITNNENGRSQVKALISSSSAPGAAQRNGWNPRLLIRGHISIGHDNMHLYIYGSGRKRSHRKVLSMSSTPWYTSGDRPKLRGGIYSLVATMLSTDHHRREALE